MAVGTFLFTFKKMLYFFNGRPFTRPLPLNDTAINKRTYFLAASRTYEQSNIYFWQHIKQISFLGEGNGIWVRQHLRGRPHPNPQHAAGKRRDAISRRSLARPGAVHGRGVHDQRGRDEHVVGRPDYFFQME